MDPERVEKLRETNPVFGLLDRRERVAEKRHARVPQPRSEPERRLPAEGDHDAERLLDRTDVEHALEREGLEVEAVRGVVVGGDRFRIRVDEDGLVAERSERARGVHAAVVELDPLPDSVRARAEHHDRASAGLRLVVRRLVREVVVRRLGLELGRARVDGEPAGPRPLRPYLELVPEHAVWDAEALRGRDRQLLGARDRAQLLREVRMDARKVEAPARRLEEQVPPLRHRLASS